MEIFPNKDHSTVLHLWAMDGVYLLNESAIWTNRLILNDSVIHSLTQSNALFLNESVVWMNQLNYLRVWQPHSVTELTPVNFQDLQTHSRNTRAVWMEQDWTTSCPSRHTVRERDALPHKPASTVWCVFSCMFSVTYSDGEMSCVSSEIFRSRQFSTWAAPVSFVFCAPPRDSNAPLSTQI